MELNQVLDYDKVSTNELIDKLIGEENLYSYDSQSMLYNICKRGDEIPLLERLISIKRIDPLENNDFQTYIKKIKRIITTESDEVIVFNGVTSSTLSFEEEINSKEIIFLSKDVDVGNQISIQYTFSKEDLAMAKEISDKYTFQVEDIVNVNQDGVKSAVGAGGTALGIFMLVALAFPILIFVVIIVFFLIKTIVTGDTSWLN